VNAAAVLALVAEKKAASARAAPVPMKLQPAKEPQHEYA
jgi:hypothetical protein